jgi:parvulin-like peptidyl-prolyl isomerase
MAKSASTDRSARRPRAPRALLPARAAAGLAALLLALAPGALGPARAIRAEALNRIVLRVNDQIATLYDYQRRRADAEREVMRRVQDPAERRQELDQVGENVFRDLFQELLITSRADQLAIEATDQEVDQQVANMRENAGIKTDEEFQSALQQYGMTLEQLRAQARRASRMRDVMAKEVTSKIKVKEEDLRRFYRKNEDRFRVLEQVQLREVVCSTKAACRRPSAVASRPRSAPRLPPARAWPKRQLLTPPSTRPAASSSSDGCRRKTSTRS